MNKVFNISTYVFLSAILVGAINAYILSGNELVNYLTGFLMFAFFAGAFILLFKSVSYMFKNRNNFRQGEFKFLVILLLLLNIIFGLVFVVYCKLNHIKLD